VRPVLAIPATAFDSAAFRQVLGHFGSGITVVTACSPDGPVGFACQSFAALSLRPPLVLCCPSRTSRTWAAIARDGQFAVNVLAEGQRELCARFGRPGADKFAGVGWARSPGGSPVLSDVLAWLDCEVSAVYDAGDHHVVVGHVTCLGEVREGRPLLYFRGAYHTVERATAVPATWPDESDWF
jgi:3-hydroxy-9,10-secoandrosta-1,3,5(10)-triene-9,17-dione monooxygenase reductase component